MGALMRAVIMRGWDARESPLQRNAALPEVTSLAEEKGMAVSPDLALRQGLFHVLRASMSSTPSPG
jgi:hypothetical protein